MTLADLLKSRDDLKEQLSAVNIEIDRCRTKCPTCRCRILPGATCACCAQPAIDIEEDR